MTRDDELVVVGRIGRPHGIRGEVTVEARTDEPAQRFADGVVLATEPAENGPLRVSYSKLHSGRWVVLFDGVTDRNEAEELRGTLLVLPLADLPELDDPDEFRDHQLIGLAAVAADGTALGTVTDVEHGPGGDMLIVTDDAGPHLIPFVTEIVPSVDLAAGRITLTPPDGLFDL